MQSCSTHCQFEIFRVLSLHNLIPPFLLTRLTAKMSQVVEEIQHKMHQVIEAVRQRDPTGYTKAENAGELLHFMSEDLKKAGIDREKASDFLQKSMTTAKKKGGSILNGFSTLVDYIFFEPFFRLFTPKDQFQAIVAVTSTQLAWNKDLKLLPIKLAFLIAARYCVNFTFQNVMKQNVYQAFIASLVSLDLLRMAYNCYVKSYFNLTAKKLGGDVFTLRDTILQSGSSESASKDPKLNPMLHIHENKIMWNLIPQNTILQFLLSPVS